MCETIDKKSMTVPDQTFTIEEILERSLRGQLPPISQKVYYDENPDETFEYMQPRPIDPTEVADARQRLDSIQTSIKSQQEASAKAAAEAAAAAAAPPATT